MTRKDLNYAYNLLALSGGLKDKCVEMGDLGFKVYVTFPTCSPRKAIVKAYHKDGKVMFEELYEGGKMYSKWFVYRPNGVIYTYKYVNE